ncbi:MAG TPA: VWA domain-containing protein [Bryobacteraceae bacterium]|nr:VWA domain-containing protein [Bryobacteraceae bacterium]
MKHLAVLGLLAIAAPGQQAVFQSETRVVIVDAVVTGRKGESVGDLTAKDFRIWEDNKEQPVRSFSRETGAPGEEPRRLVLFFDFSGMSASDQAGVRQAAADFIDAAFAGGKRPLLAVAALDESFRLAQTFTNKAERLKQAVRGLKIDTSPAGDTPVAVAAQELTVTLENLARNLGALPGRKALVVFSSDGGFTGAQNGGMAGLAQMCNRSNVALYPVVSRASSTAEAQTAGIAGLDCDQRRPAPRNGLAPKLQPCSVPDDNGLNALAGATGGYSTFTTNDLLVQLKKIAAEQNEYYVLSYSPPASRSEACHSLRLKVDRKSVVLRARSSYCSQRPQDLLAESRVERDLEKHAAAPQIAGAAAAIEAPFFYAVPGVARVHVSLEIPTGMLKFENQRGKLQTEINLLGIASAPDGSVAARFSDVVRRSFDNQRDADAFKERPLHYEKEFRIAPGQYNLAVVFSSGGTKFGRVETPLSIAAQDNGRLAVSGLALGQETRAAAEIGLVASLLDQSDSLVANDLQLVPSGSRTFDKGGQAFCYFEIYAPGAVPLSMRARILDSSSGQTKWDGGVAGVDRPSSRRDGIPVAFGLPISSLPSGSWKLEITVIGGSDTAQRAIDFKIR